MPVSHQIWVLFIALLFSGSAFAFEVAVEFSAQAVQQAPMRPEYRAAMYVGKDAVRTESTINSIPVVEILNSKQQTRVLLVAKEKIYLQQRRDPNAVSAADKPNPDNPCAGLANTTCKKLGVETINDRKTQKWEFTQVHNGQSYRSLHWIDMQHHMPIREFYPDGTVTELNMLGNETIDGRKTEKWSMLMTRANGEQMTSTQWYDPQLKIAIREELQGGFIRELRDIKIGKQDKKLFEIPAGYKQAEQLPAYLRPQQPPVGPGQ